MTCTGFTLQTTELQKREVTIVKFKYSIDNVKIFHDCFILSKPTNGDTLIKKVIKIIIAKKKLNLNLHQLKLANVFSDGTRQIIQNDQELWNERRDYILVVNEFENCQVTTISCNIL